MNQKLSLLSFVFLINVIYSCTSYKNVPYFQDVNRSEVLKENINNYSPLTIQPGDILGINVSSLNPEASAIFNYSVNISGTESNNQNNPAIGYLVDQKGEINFPLIGTIKVSGLTTSQLRVNTRQKLLAYLKEPIVNVRILNFKISIIGDVQHPGIFNVLNERITVTEALSMAGDLNITAKRKNILLIREQNGTREYISIDLTSKNLFQSPYYYLRSNDVLYVEPDRTKYAAVDNSYRTISLLLSALSIAAIIITRYY
jgi:polysaccharide export outer membrane protein